MATVATMVMVTFLTADIPNPKYQEIQQRVSKHCGGLDKDSKDALRKDLLAYCEMDTLAMVKIVERFLE